MTEGTYDLRCGQEGMTYRVKRVRWDRHELLCMLTIDTTVPGIRNTDGRMSMGTFSITSTSQREARARQLATLARAPELDFSGQLEELCQRVLLAEEKGRPVLLLNTVEPKVNPEANQVMVCGFPVLLRHPTILFGDGGTGKSTLALYIAGMLERHGVSTLFLDWELDEYDHRKLLAQLFGADMPDVKYRRCDRPLAIEAESLADQVAECGIDYVICDSVAFACVGAPETAEAAQGYFRALRPLKVGSLHLAHVTKGENADKKPFGSSFWFNSVRACWYAERADGAPGDDTVDLGLFQRKFNLGPARPSIGMSIRYDADRITITPSDVANNDQLAAKMSIAQRMQAALRHGAKTTDELAAELDLKPNQVRSKLSKSRTMIRLGDGRIGLAVAHGDSF